jgi:hypothetical protein
MRRERFGQVETWPQGERVMALADLLSIAVKGDWLSKVEEGVTIAESIGPALLKVGMDGMAVSSGDPAAILKFVQDIEALIPQIDAAIKANNTEVAPAALPAVEGQSS